MSSQKLTHSSSFSRHRHLCPQIFQTPFRKSGASFSFRRKAGKTAYNQKLVKQIAVRGITMRGLAGTNAYLYLEAIEISKKAPVARIDLEVKLETGEIKRTLRRLESGRDLYVESHGLDQYRGFTISQIDYNQDAVEFTNGHRLTAGQATGDGRRQRG